MITIEFSWRSFVQALPNRRMKLPRRGTFERKIVIVLLALIRARSPRRVYPLTFTVRPRPGNPDHGKIMFREVTILIPSTTEDGATAAAPELVDEQGFDIEAGGKARELNVDSDRMRASSQLGKLIDIIERDGRVLLIGSEFPPL